MTPKVTVAHCATLQRETDDQPWLTGSIVQIDGRTAVVLHEYPMGAIDDPADPAPSVGLVLPYGAWATLAEMWILRYPEAAGRLVTKAQGWGVPHGKGRP